MIKRFFVIFVILISCTTARANFVFDSNCIEAYKAILALKMTEAKALIRKEKQVSPQNGITVLLDNYVDYFSLLASENKGDYDRLKVNLSTRISALEDNDKNSPYYLYSQAEIYIQWSFLKAKFGDYTSSAFTAKKAGGLLKDNSKKYPDFLPNQKSLALVNVVFGSIPASFKGITRFLGMSGDVKTGVKQLEALRLQLPKTGYSFYNDELVFFLCTIDINVLHSKNSYNKLISYLSTMDPNSLLRSYLQGYAAAKTAHNDDAIDFLSASPKSGQYITVPAIDYLLGTAKLNRMDNDTPVFLNKYLSEYKGATLVKDTYLRLSYYYLLQNDADKFAYYNNLVKTRGSITDEKDKQAFKEANDSKPDQDLLKARFLFDGGYYSKALAQLNSKNVSDFKLQRDKIEYYYRIGRIYDNTGKDYEATQNYQKAIALGKTSGYYYASNAALRIGNIYEGIKDYTKAALYYNQALDMKNHEYQTSTDNDAKEGLKRIGQ